MGNEVGKSKEQGDHGLQVDESPDEEDRAEVDFF